MGDDSIEHSYEHFDENEKEELMNAYLMQMKDQNNLSYSDRSTFVTNSIIAVFGEGKSKAWISLFSLKERKRLATSILFNEEMQNGMITYYCNLRCSPDGRLVMLS